METSIKLMAAVLDGKHIGYSSDTEFLVQVGKGKGSYKTRWAFKGNFAQAFMYYQMINVGNGYKKRLYSPHMNKPTIAKRLS